MVKSEINRIILEEIKLFFEDFKFDNDQKRFFPSDSMINNCKRALKAISQNDLTTHGGNEGSGKEKANSIINKEPMTHAMLKRMNSFFDNNYEKYQSELGKGKTLMNSGIIQTWNLWGGDAGKQMSNSSINYTQRDNQKRKKLKTFISPTKTTTLMDPHNTRIRR